MDPKRFSILRRLRGIFLKSHKYRSLRLFVNTIIVNAIRPTIQGAPPQLTNCIFQQKSSVHYNNSKFLPAKAFYMNIFFSLQLQTKMNLPEILQDYIYSKPIRPQSSINHNQW